MVAPGKCLGKSADVADRGAAPAVDRLVGVAHGADVAVHAAEELQDLGLGRVRVLILVDEDMEEPVRVLLPDSSVFPEEPGREEQEIVEVDGVRPLQSRLVELVQPLHQHLGRVPGGRLSRRHEAILQEADAQPDVALGRDASERDLLLLQDAAKEPIRSRRHASMTNRGERDPLARSRSGAIARRTSGRCSSRSRRARSPARV